MKGTSRQPGLIRSVLFEMALEQKAQGRRLAELRERKRWTQPIAADKIGVALRTYQDWESGASRPRWNNLERAAEVYNISVEALIGNEPLSESDGATPDLIGHLNGDAPPPWAKERFAQLDRIEENQQAILDYLAAFATARGGRGEGGTGSDEEVA